jgi:phage shock protein PspC (stress-responsive transcriptional regulator)
MAHAEVMTASTPPIQHAGASFFQWVRQQGIYRSTDRWFGGVASGVARRLGWDPILVRGLFVVAALITGVGLALYGAAWLVLPEEADGRIHLEEVICGRITAGFWGGAVCAFFGLVLTPTWMWAGGGFGFALVLAFCAAGLALLAYAGNQGRARASAPPAASQTAPPGGPFPQPTPAAAPSGEGGAARPFFQT